MLCTFLKPYQFNKGSTINHYITYIWIWDLITKSKYETNDYDLIYEKTLNEGWNLFQFLETWLTSARSSEVAEKDLFPLWQPWNCIFYL